MAKRKTRSDSNTVKRKTRRDAIPKLTKKLDEVFSQYVRLVNSINGICKCYTCDHSAFWKGEYMQAGHYVPRQHKSIRWDVMNVKPQCYSCNMKYGGRPQEYRERLVQEYGEKEVVRLEQRRHEVTPADREWLQAEIKRYKKLVSELENS